MDKELIGYTCLFCRKHGKEIPDISADMICCFDKDELQNEPSGPFFYCKDDSSDYIEYEPEYIVEVYKR